MTVTYYCKRCGATLSSKQIAGGDDSFSFPEERVAAYHRHTDMCFSNLLAGLNKLKDRIEALEGDHDTGTSES